MAFGVYNKLALLRNATRWIRPYGRVLCLGMVTVLISSGLTLLMLSLIRQTLAAFSRGDAMLWSELGLALIGRSVFGFIGAYVLGRVGARAITDARQEFFAAFVRAPLSFHDEQWSADLVSTLTADAAFIQEALGQVLPRVASHGPTAMVVLVLLWAENGGLTVALTLAGLPLLAFVLAAGRAQRQLVRDGQSTLGRAAIIAQESLLGLRLIKALTREDFFVRRFAHITETHYALKCRRGLWQSLGENVVPIAAAMIGLCGLWVAQRQLAAGETTPERLATFAAYLLVFGTSAPELIHAYASLEPIVGAVQRMSEVRRAVAVDEPQGGQTIMQAMGAVDLQSVTFAYPHGRGGIYDVALRIEPGESVAIVGPNGAGKSTLMHLLLRFYQPQQGCIRLAGRCADDVNLAAWRRQFALVTRDPVIFSLSLAENIALGRPDASRAEVESAARAVRLHDFVQTLPGGYAALVGESGVRLSAGQRQRLALARVFLQNPSVIIFDEATTSLDAESEAAFTAAINQWAGTRTIIFISHRPETLRAVTRTIRMEAGRIVADTKKCD